MVLWGDLGRKFVGDTGALQIFQGTDPCNAHTTKYLYAVQGGDIVNGWQFYDVTLAGNRQIIWYGDTIPSINCPASLYFRQSLPPGGSGWSYAKEYRPESFVFDFSLTNIAVSYLTTGADVLLDKVKKQFNSITAKYQAGDSPASVRYWFWNMVASKTLKGLVDSGALTRRGNGQFKIEEQIK